MKKSFSYLLLSPIFSLLALTALSVPTPANAVIAEQPCNTYSWTNEDDTAHQMVLTNPLTLGDITYETTYVTTNGTLTFGTPDANFSSYPNTPSISLAGYDWVTWSGGYLSYGATDTGFCVEWKVRPFPQSSGAFTTIKLTVDISRLPSWSGIIETTGWLPSDLRRGIRFTSGQDVVTISEAFSINGGRPVEMQTCWDNSIIPLTSTCPAEPPPGQCWDGSTIPWNGTCPPVPPDIQCWDGSWVTWSQVCPAIPPPIVCWDNSIVPYNGTCPPVPPDIVCWNGEIVTWNGTCQQVPPPIECWDGTSVNWDAQCPAIPPDITCWDGSIISWNVTCPIEPSPTPTPEPTQSQSPEPTIEPTPQPSEPSPEPSQSSEPTLEPSPIPTPSASESIDPEPLPTLDPTPEPEPSFPSEPSPTPEESPAPDLVVPDIPSDNNITEITNAEIDSFISDAGNDGSISNAETEELINNFLSDGEISYEEVAGLQDSLTEDGILTEDEKDLLVDVILEQADGNAISTELINELGLDYEDLPPETPVALENGVILMAEVADALEIFSNPSEILGAVFTDPGKALTAVANIGADMTPEKREESQKVVVASVIAAQVLSASSVIGRMK